jgi:hypothetical protein
MVVNLGFTIAPGYDPIIARSTKHTYNDHGFEWDNSGRMDFILDLDMNLNYFATFYLLKLCLMNKQD